MHPNPVFHDATRAQNLTFARKRGFGVLTINGADGPLVSHVPFVLTPDDKSVEAHLVRSNPIARALKDGAAKAVLAVSGGDSYVSPDWYGIDDQVPTWNYLAVHMRGELRLRADSDLRGHLDDLSGEFEKRLHPKPLWTADKVDADALVKMMRMIVPVRMHIAEVDGTWKLGQNKGHAARRAAGGAIAEHGLGQEVQDIARRMNEATDR